MTYLDDPRSQTRKKIRKKQTFFKAFIDRLEVVVIGGGVGLFSTKRSAFSIPNQMGRLGEEKACFRNYSN
jgi:hypothetical protein